jgi:hypothetical protein
MAALLWRNQSTLMPIDFQTIMLPLLKHCEDGQEHAFRIDYDLGVPTFATYGPKPVRRIIIFMIIIYKPSIRPKMVCPKTGRMMIRP